MKFAIAAVLLSVALANGAPLFAYNGAWPYSAYPYAAYPTTYSYAPVAPAPAPVAYVAPAFSQSQYHSQDELGQASFGYAHPGQAAVNYRDAFGNQVGSYAYINPEGKEVRVSYTADHRGFRVLSNALPEGPAVPEAEAAVLPEPVQDTPEVAEAKAAHLAAHAAAKAGIFPAGPEAPVAPEVELPGPVDYTPEVAAARAEHAKAWEEAKAAADAAPEEAGSRKKRQAIAYNPFYSNYYGYPYASYPTTYSYAPVAPAPAPVAYVAPAFSQSQYHSQDELGQASFGYAHPGQAAVNYRDAAGNQIGSYAYINPEGKEVRVSYTADHRGFRVLSNALPEGPAVPEAEAAVLPEPVQDTPEVAEAKAAHLAAHAAAKAGIFPAGPEAPVAPEVELPAPVDYTPEVAAARAEHAKAWEEAKAAADASPEESA